jgi:hypothetical protein
MTLLKIFFHFHYQKRLLARVDKGPAKRCARCFGWLKKLSFAVWEKKLRLLDEKEIREIYGTKKSKFSE